MTMADRNISSQRDGDESSSVEHVDPPYVPHLRFSASDTPTLGGYESERRACNLDLSNSPSLRPGSAARDSGYNTDVSPAATISPATNTPRQQHFVFENLSHSQTTELEDRLSTQPHQPSYHFQFEQRPKSTPPLRLSPDIFKVSASPGRTVCPGTRTSSRPVSEASDTNRVQFDFESDEEEDNNNRRDNIGSRFSAPRVRSGEQFDLSESFLGVHVPDLSHDSDEDDDEDVFYKSDDILKNWGISSEPQTPRCRKSSLSLRQRRYCSTDEDDSQLGACGGHDPRGDTLSLGTNPAHDRRSNTLSASFGGYEGDLRSCVRNGSRAEERRSVRGSILNRHCESSLICSQHFQPSHSDHDSRENGSENAFTFDCDDIDDDEKEKVAQKVHHRDNHTVSIFRQGLPQSPVFRTRWRRISVTAHLRLSTGCLLPWSGAIHRVSVSTQTPHITSLMIQQILDTPCPLPNEARGTAAARLRRRQSEGGIPPGSRPLPDIIPFVRDRALSVPDLQTLARMQRAREFGRELRRLSDEFHFGITLNPVREETDGRLRIHHFLHNPLSHIWKMFKRAIRGRAFRSRHSTSVDIEEEVASVNQTDHTEDLPGD